MSAAEVITQIEALPKADLKLVERALRRLTHPEVPDEVWEGYEDYEAGRFVDADLILREQPPEK